jgi:hypothetical protein
MFNPHIDTSVGRFFMGFFYEEPPVLVMYKQIETNRTPKKRQGDYSM